MPDIYNNYYSSQSITTIRFPLSSDALSSSVDEKKLLRNT